MLCEYGCGGEANYQFKNGRWCCSKSFKRCSAQKKLISKLITGKIHSEETKTKMSKSRKGRISGMLGKTHSEETRKKMSEWQIGKIHSEETKTKISYSKIGKSSWNAGKVLSKESKKKMSLSSKININKIQNKYPIFSKIEEMRYNPDKPGEKEIQVRCKNNLCKKEWFTPTYIQLYERIRQLENENGNMGSYFYCSDECKDECPLYGKRLTQLITQDKINAGIIKEPLYTSTEILIYNKEVLSRSNNLCEYCGKSANTVHHSRPQKLEPFFALDPDFGVACCQECHYKYGHKDECSTGKIAYTVCK